MYCSEWWGYMEQIQKQRDDESDSDKKVCGYKNVLFFF